MLIVSPQIVSIIDIGVFADVPKEDIDLYIYVEKDIPQKLLLFLELKFFYLKQNQHPPPQFFFSHIEKVCNLIYSA